MAEKLGARKNSSWKAICTAPDFCKTPVGSSTPPIPYQVIADLGQSENCVPSVRFNGDPCFVFNPSTVPTCTGDEPGTAKGVKSGTVQGQVKATDACPNVRAESKQVVRKDDPGTMNDGNCSCIFTTQPAPGGALGAGGEPIPKKQSVTPDTPGEVQAAHEKKGLWGMISGPVHVALGVAGFIPGLGAIPDVLDAGVYALEGDAINAGLSLGAAVPFAGDAVKAGTLVGKAGKHLGRELVERGFRKGLEKEGRQRLGGEAAQRLGSEGAQRLERNLATGTTEKAVQKTGQEAGGTAGAAAGKEGKKGTQVKKKGKLKCGEYGKYGALKKKTGGGKLDRDHVPSKAALKERARQLAAERGDDSGALSGKGHRGPRRRNRHPQGCPQRKQPDLWFT